jgi:uncharacterized membrane protein YgcG
MTVESSPQYPADLNEAYPGANDSRVEGDDHIRNTKTALKNAMPGYSGALAVTATDSGSANAYILTPSRTLPSYTLGTLFVFKALNANTGACTVNVSGLGVKSIKTISGADPSAGDVFGEVILRYDGTNMVIVGGSGFLSKTGTQTVAGDINFTTGPTVPTASAGTSNSRAASHAFVAATAFAAALPAQAGNSGKVVTTDGTNASWGYVGQALVERTSNTIITNADKGKLIRITSGTFSQTFDPVANFDADFWVDYENAGTGDVTHDPNAAETIDARATIPQYSNEIRRIRRNAAGTAWETTVRRAFFKSFTASNASAPVPTGYKLQGRRAIGGGGSGGTGGGGGSGSGSGAGGGGGGGGGSSGGVGAIEVRIADASLFSATEAVVVGAGGAAQASVGTGGAGVSSATSQGTDGTNGTAGNAGGTSSSGVGLLTTVSAVGGTAGGAGKLGNKGNGAVSGLASAASDATAAAGTSGIGATMVTDYAGLAGTTAIAGSAGVSGTSGGAGGNGGSWPVTNFSLGVGTLIAGGATQNTAAPAAGNNGAIGLVGGSVGQGGNGSGGGSGSRGASGGSASGKGGDSAASGPGADGRVDWWGVM